MTEALREVGGALEVRVSGRTLLTEFRYGQRARDRAEFFEPGSLEVRADATLNLQHDPMIEVASRADGSLRVTDSPEALSLEADLQGAPLELVRRGRLTGISPEFFARRERRDAGLRVVELADVPAFGLVDRGSYATPVELRRAAETLDVELRAKMGRSMSASIPSGKKLRCECSGPDARWAEFVEKPLVEAFDRIFETAEREVLATWANYSQPLASKSRGTLRRTGPAEVTIDLPDDAYGRAAIAAHESTGVVVRPYLDPVDSVGELVDETMHYSHVEIRAFVVSSTDARQGWPTPRITATPDVEPRAAAGRFPAWL